MSGTQFIAIAVLTWLAGLALLLKMVLRPLTDLEWKSYRGQSGPWFWIDLFGGDRTRENLARFIQRGGVAGLVIWIVVLVIVVAFADWSSIVAMEKPY